MNLLKKDDLDLLEFGVERISENIKLKDFKIKKIIYKDENVTKNNDGNIFL